MKRREFLTVGSAGLAALATTATASAQVRDRLIPLGNRTTRPNAPRVPRQFIEVRRYTVKDEDKRTQLVDILDKALIPALNRQGLRPVGVLNPIKRETPLEREAKFANSVFVVIPHRTTATFVSTAARLRADAVYMRDAAPIFETTSRDPVYTDCETFLLHGFPTLPGVEVPNLGPDRVFEMRLYRSFNIERNEAKIHMFDEGGELPLFRKVGLNPIFFGDILAGTRMPAFLYIVGCPSLQAHAEAWRTFVSHPEWIAMKDLPEYADTATEIESVVLTPSAGSQI